MSSTHHQTCSYLRTQSLEAAYWAESDHWKRTLSKAVLKCCSLGARGLGFKPLEPRRFYGGPKDLMQGNTSEVRGNYPPSRLHTQALVSLDAFPLPLSHPDSFVPFESMPIYMYIIIRCPLSLIATLFTLQASPHSLNSHIVVNSIDPLLHLLSANKWVSPVAYGRKKGSRLCAQIHYKTTPSQYTKHMGRTI